MTFEQWWKSKWPATIDEAGFALLEEAWQMAFCDGYEKGVAAFHEAVKMEREACARVCREIAILRLDSGMEPGCCSQVADMCNVAILKRSNDKAQGAGGGLIAGGSPGAAGSAAG